MHIKEIIETLEVAKAEVEWDYPMNYYIALEEAIKILNGLKWNPYNVPPNEYGEYLCCVENEDGSVEVKILYYGAFDKVVRWYTQTDAENLEPTKIIAWRPKPDSVTADTIEAELIEEREIELGNLLFGNSRGTVPVPRGRWEDRFHDFLYKGGFDMYGYIDKENLKQYEKVIYSEGENHHYFENDTFIIMPYWWGDSEEISQMPNFVYKPTGYEVQWYKWPLRDSYANREVSYKEFCDILDKCTASIVKDSERRLK